MTAAVVLASVAFWAPFKYIFVGDNAKPETLEGRVRFKRLKTSERKKLDARLAANRLDADVATALRKRLDDPANKLAPKVRATIEANLAADPIDDCDFLSLMLVDLDFKDSSGKPIIYSPARLEELCEELDGLEGVLVNSYFDARSKALEPKAVEKNSGEPSGTGS